MSGARTTRLRKLAEACLEDVVLDPCDVKFLCDNNDRLAREFEELSGKHAAAQANYEMAARDRDIAVSMGRDLAKERDEALVRVTKYFTQLATVTKELGELREAAQNAVLALAEERDAYKAAIECNELARELKTRTAMWEGLRIKLEEVRKERDEALSAAAKYQNSRELSSLVAEDLLADLTEVKRERDEARAEVLELESRLNEVDAECARQLETEKYKEQLAVVTNERDSLLASVEFLRKDNRRIIAQYRDAMTYTAGAGTGRCNWKSRDSGNQCLKMSDHPGSCLFSEQVDGSSEDGR